MTEDSELIFEKGFVMTRYGLFSLNPADARFKENEYIKVIVKADVDKLTGEQKKKLRDSYVRYYKISADRMFRISSIWNIPVGTPLIIKVRVLVDDKEKKEANQSIGDRYGKRGWPRGKKRDRK